MITAGLALRMEMSKGKVTGVYRAYVGAVSR